MKKIKFTENFGAVKEGDVYIRGLHGVPEAWKDEEVEGSDFFWKESSEKKDHAFLHLDAFDKSLYEVIELR